MSILPCNRSEKSANFRCAQAGCENCLENLIRQNEGLIHAFLKQTWIGGLAYADLAQEGRIALWKAILHYDTERGVAFSSYAWVAIRNRMWNATRRSRWRDIWELEERWLDLRLVAEDRVWRGQVRQALEEATNCLPQRLRKVIELVYGLREEPHSLAAIGREWDISRERVRQLRNEALALLRIPVVSIRIRSLYEQESRQAYRRTQRLNRAWWGRRGQR